MKYVGKFGRHLVCFSAISYILWTFGIFCGQLVYLFCGHLVYFEVNLVFFHFLVFCTKTNLATLVGSMPLSINKGFLSLSLSELKEKSVDLKK
jgi:hypothetical protein